MHEIENFKMHELNSISTYLWALDIALNDSYYLPFICAITISLQINLDMFVGHMLKSIVARIELQRYDVCTRAFTHSSLLKPYQYLTHH